MNEIVQIILFSILILIIELYSETHLKNYGRFIERLVYLFSIKTLFNLFKFSVLISFIYIIIDNVVVNNFVRTNILSFNDENFLIYLSPTFIFSIFVTRYKSRQLHRQLEDYSIQNEKVNNIIANVKYLIFRVISFVLTTLIFIGTLVLIIYLDSLLKSKNFTMFDWLTIDGNGVNNYNKGVYFSLFLTTILFFLFNNSFIKKNSGDWEYRKIKLSFFKYFFITLIISLGLFFGFFSIFNGIYNLLNSNASEWISTENVLGILPIRISSLLILFYLLGYVYKEVINRQLFSFLILGIFPFRRMENFRVSIDFNKRETLFFSQISFYILNIALAEYFIIIGFKNIYLSILNFAILFILDDFKIINDYSKGLHRVMPGHFYRIWLFNLIMFIVAFILLFTKENWHILLMYLLFSAILFKYYLKNFQLINLRKSY
ncbi:hypothetical protein [Myroides odoratimimus]|uniref:hypothetical protein n=1 Tax=Myroides odoratimimus TaxID=76832 RepID=UPI0031013DA2